MKAADSLKTRVGEDPTTPRAPRDVRLAHEAIRGGLIEDLQRVEKSPPPDLASVAAAPEPLVRVSPTAEIVDLIRQIALGRYDGEVPARDVIQAARLLCTFGVPMPAKTVEVKAALIQIVDPYHTEGDAVDVPTG